nr:PREDICTED: dynein beta chain, ciliary-like [Megachile rotundata]
MADKKDGDKTEEDKRLEFIYDYLAYSRKIKADKWMKMLSNSDFKGIINKFFGTPSEMILTLQMTPGGLLVPGLEIIRTTKKLTYFIKRKSEKITENNFRQILIPGDMAPNPIEELAVLVEDSPFQFSSNSPNLPGIRPNLIKPKKPRRLAGSGTKGHNQASIRPSQPNMAETFEKKVKGKITGQSLLPLPMGIEEILREGFASQPDSLKLQLKSNIEEIVTKWSSQINEILNVEFSEFSNGGDQLPEAELDYWNTRLKNMESLYRQLKDPKVVKMDEFLSETESPYSKYFKDLIKNVAASVQFSDFLRENDDEENDDISKHINPSTLFEGDIEENKVKIDEAIPFLDFYQDTFRMFKDRIETYFKSPIEPVPWTFHEKLVLERVQSFRARLREIKVYYNFYVRG